MGEIRDILGQRFGRLVAVARGTNGPKGKWRFKCDCGKYKIMNKHNVIHGRSRSCGCLCKERMHSRLKNLVGKSFGRLLVLKFEKFRKHQALWRCRCMCGVEVVVQGGNLCSGHTKGCGCLSIYKYAKGAIGLRLLRYRYMQRAKRHEKEFLLSAQEFEGLTQSRCHYCGMEPKTISKSKSEHSEYCFNGIDRVDSNKGYFYENVVPCCEICNKMKRKMTTDEFKLHITRLHDSLKLKGPNWGVSAQDFGD